VPDLSTKTIITTIKSLTSKEMFLKNPDLKKELL
jgi:hypothetical protein